MALTQAIIVIDQDAVLGTAPQKPRDDKFTLQLCRSSNQKVARQNAVGVLEQVSSDCPGCYTLLVFRGLLSLSFVICSSDASWYAHFFIWPYLCGLLCTIDLNNGRNQKKHQRSCNATIPMFIIFCHIYHDLWLAFAGFYPKPWE